MRKLVNLGFVVVMKYIVGGDEMMVKSKRKRLSSAESATGVMVNVLLIVLLLGVLFVPVAIWQGWISMAWLAKLTGKDLVPDLDDPTYEPPAALSCSSYDISDEFRNAFGSANIDVLESNCIAIGGVWYEQDDQMGCWWDPVVLSIDCAQDAIVTMTRFCEGILKANYICDNSIAYAGCNCKVSAPSDWNAADSQQDHDGGEFVPGSVGTIFVSSNLWNGAMGGLSGADMKCAVSAQYSGMTGTYRAIMSDSSTDARDRIPDMAYYNVAGQLIASSRSNLWDGGIDNAVLYTEKDVPITGNLIVWTGTTTGGYGSGQYCNDWGFVDSRGDVGQGNHADYSWIDAGDSVCSLRHRIYCARVA